MPGFRIIFFPEFEFDGEHGCESNSIWKELERIRKRHKKKHKKLMQILRLLQKPDTGQLHYDNNFKTGTMYSMPKECDKDKSKPLLEIRYPKRCVTGVLRAYFCHSKHLHSKLVVLDVEHKTETKGSTIKACNNRDSYWSKHDRPE